MSQDTNVENLIINKLTKAQYESVTNPDPTQLYFITDEGESISTLDDVSLNNIANGQILKYNATTQKWENSTMGGGTWGNITGTLSNQTDLQTALDAKQNTISDLSTIRNGATLGATALQPNDNITELVNNAGYITSADLPTVDQTYDATSANAQSGVAINGAGFLKNTATGLYSISVDGNATTENHAINIGFRSTSNIASIAIGSNSTSRNNGVSLGSQAKAGSFCVAIGSNAKIGTSVVNAIQLGSNSTNTESNTFYVSFNGSNEALGLNYKLLDGTTGLIPDARISSNIARTSSLSTVATTGDYDDLTNKPTIPDISNLANKDLSNLSSTGNAKFQEPLVSGTNIKTINNTSLVGSGNIDTNNIFWATYDTTTFTDIMTAINAGKLVLCREIEPSNDDHVYTYSSHTNTSIAFYNVSGSSNYIVTVDESNVWDLIDASLLPSQRNQSGKYLTTNGTTPSWATVPTPTYNSTNERITWA